MSATCLHNCWSSSFKSHDLNKLKGQAVNSNAGGSAQGKAPVRNEVDLTEQDDRSERFACAQAKIGRNNLVIG